MHLRRLVLAACAALLLLACKTADAPPAAEKPAPPVDPVSCHSACDGAYDRCAYQCQQNVDNQMCGEECVDTLESCKKRC